MEFEYWLKTVCFHKPTPEALDFAKAAWEVSRLNTEANKLPSHISIEIKDGWITLEVINDIKISYPVFGEKTSVACSINRFSRDLKKALYGERISTLG